MSRSLIEAVRPFIPAGLRPAVRSVRRALHKVSYIPIDAWSRLKGRDDLTPPPSLIFVGDGDFREIGEEFAKYFIDLGRLKPDDNVLDVGCGIGRMAVPLTRYISGKGRYVGFDIVREGIDWAIKSISARNPAFTFVLADIYNKGYNPKGKLQAREYRFPADDNSVDFLLATSVLTHLLPGDAGHYLAETSRVLRPGGRCFITFFLLNEESVPLIEAGKSILDFRFPAGDGAQTIDKTVPENAVAYPEQYLRATYGKLHLKIVDPVHYGSWCGREKFLSKQDIVIAQKEA